MQDSELSSDSAHLRKTSTWSSEGGRRSARRVYKRKYIAVRISGEVSKRLHLDLRFGIRTIWYSREYQISHLHVLAPLKGQFFGLLAMGSMA